MRRTRCSLFIIFLGFLPISLSFLQGRFLVRLPTKTLANNEAAPSLSSLLPLTENDHQLAVLSKRGMTCATPIQEASMPLVLKGHSLSLHAETGSGKTLALLSPLLLRIGDRAVSDDCRVLILAPSRELAAQLADEARALLPPGAGATVRLVCAGEPFVPTVASLQSAFVVVATPTELGEWLAKDKALTEWLPTALGALVLDEVDVLIPAKQFSGKRVMFMDAGMHPTEGLVKLICRRNSRPDFQVLAASASLDAATQRKLTRLLRASPTLRLTSVPLPVIKAANQGGAKVLQSAPSKRSNNDDYNDSGGGGERTTLVPSVIEHRTLSMDSNAAKLKDPLKLLRLAANQVLKEGKAGGAEARQSIGLVVLCSSLPLKVRVVTRELTQLGFEVVSLSDALWPDSTRAVKAQKNRGVPTTKFLKTKEEEEEQLPGDDAAAAESASLSHRLSLLDALKSPIQSSSPSNAGGKAAAQASKRMKLVVTDQFRTRGLHLDDVDAVFILGAAANADTYLHLAGRTGRWPRVEGGTVVSIAPDKELRKLCSWSAELGGVEFKPVDF